MNEKIRTFDTGATRNLDATKIDPDGFFSIEFMRAYCDYMNEHRKQADGSVRESNNWKKGIPQDAYMKSMWRHFMDVWTLHHGGYLNNEKGFKMTKTEALMALAFNVMGMAHEEIKGHNVVGTIDDNGMTTPPRSICSVPGCKSCPVNNRT